MGSLGDRLRSARKELDLTQGQLAERAGSAQQTIQRIESGETTQPRNLDVIALVLGVSVEWLTYGVGAISDNVSPGPKIGGLAPVVSWVQAGSWADIDSVDRQDCQEWRPLPGSFGPNSFFLRVKGDSMESSHNKRSVPEGALIVVDPDAEPSSGSLVVAMTPDAQEATFKQFIIDGGRIFLKPFNDRYPVLEFPQGTKIVGVVKTFMVDL